MLSNTHNTATSVASVRAHRAALSDGFHVHEFVAPHAASEPQLRLAVRDPVAALVPVMLRPDVEPHLCLSGRRFACLACCGSCQPVAFAGCSAARGVSRPCQGHFFHTAVEQVGGTVGAGAPASAPLAFAVCSDRLQKPSA